MEREIPIVGNEFQSLGILKIKLLDRFDEEPIGWSLKPVLELVDTKLLKI